MVLIYLTEIEHTQVGRVLGISRLPAEAARFQDRGIIT